MRTIAFCCRSTARITQRAAGVEKALTSPPVTVDTFTPAMIQGADLLYLKLHGIPHQPYLYGDCFTTACSAEQIESCDLAGCVVFAAVCHLPETPLLQALFQAGARAVIAGHGSNYAAKSRVYGADKLGMLTRRLLRLHVPPHVAFRLAKARMARGRQDRFTLDALRFEYYEQ
jgi:hypothetical protein